MKTFFVLLIALFLASCQKNSIDEPIDNAKGKIKQITEIDYSATMAYGIIQKKSVSGSYKKEYDSDGFPTFSTSYFQNGTIEQKEIFKKKDDYTLTSDVTEIDGSVYSTIKYTLDKNRNAIESYEYKKDGKLISHFIQTFNGIKIEKQIYYDTSSSIPNTYTTTYKCDDSGNIINEVCYMGTYLNDQEDYTYTQFDEQKNWTSRTVKYDLGKSYGVEERIIEYY